jgi:hypothetical protein
MFDNPEITRQLVAGRLDRRRHEAARRRLAGPARPRHRMRFRFRTAPATWFARHRRTGTTADPATA